MTRYISNPDNLKLMMNMLKEKSRNIQFEAFHVFKVRKDQFDMLLVIGTSTQYDTKNRYRMVKIFVSKTVDFLLHFLRFEIFYHKLHLLPEVFSTTYNCMPGHNLATFLQITNTTALYNCDFQVFVANPNKPKPILDILLRNQDKLVDFLSKFHTDRSEDEQFNDEKAYLIKQIKDLKPMVDAHWISLYWLRLVLVIISLQQFSPQAQMALLVIHIF